MKKFTFWLLVAIVCALNVRAQQTFVIFNGLQLPFSQYKMVNWVPDEEANRSMKVVATGYNDTNATVIFNTSDGGTATAYGFDLKLFLKKVAAEEKNEDRYYDIGEDRPLQDEDGQYYRQFDIGDPSKFFLLDGPLSDFDPDHQGHVDVYIVHNKSTPPIALNE